MTHLRAMMSAGAAVGVGLLLTGCLGGGGSVRAPSGVEGAWLNAGGTTVQTLSGGTFQAAVVETGERLSEGTYTMTGPNTVSIKGVSRVSQSAISVNCVLLSANQLNCTSANGQQFALTRRA